MKQEDNLLDCERKPKTYLERIRFFYSEKSVGYMFYTFLIKLQKKKEAKKNGSI